MDWKKMLFELLIRGIMAMTPEIRTLLCKGLDELLEKAKGTPNPLDDGVIEALKAIFECDAD